MNPHGMRQKQFKLGNGELVHIYSDKGRIFLQMRKATPTEIDILSPSFKVAVELSASEAVAIAAELVQAALTQQIPRQGAAKK